MKLTILGCSGPYPVPGGACSGYLVVTDNGTKVAMDLGSGCLSALTGYTAPEELDAILLSHWHFDHASDLLPLTYRLADAAARGTKPLHVYAPVDEASPIRAILKNTSTVCLHDIHPGDTLMVNGLRIVVFEARHPVPAVMYKLTVTDGTDSGKVLAFTGDTNTTADLQSLAAGTDLLLADGLFPADAWQEKLPHLSAYLAAQLGAEANAKQLVLTHFSPRFPQQLLLDEARKACLRVKLASPGTSYTV